MLKTISLRKAFLVPGFPVVRALPTASCRMVGAWCFLDYFGPRDLETSNEFYIKPHPHIGLQTFTWMLKGSLLHKDSLGNEQIIHPGQVNLMSSGNGIVHSEQSCTPGILEGLQLWIALPESTRHQPPEFNHLAATPYLEEKGCFIHVMVGEYDGIVNPLTLNSPLIGLYIVGKGVKTRLRLRPDFEYALMPLDEGSCLDDVPLTPSNFYYLGTQLRSLNLNIPQDKRMILLGGEPFNEKIIMWWNFVARTKDELREAVAAWNERRFISEMNDEHEERMQAPLLP